MTDELKTIVLEFEAALLNGVRNGADEAELSKIRDRAFDQLRDVKEGPAAPSLESIFDVAGEIGIKFEMALEAIKS
ncbi:hypothetical protein [Bradyrhizobium zhanjiangense]|uniref:Uncharacterized protein n=1 Tax=Bradyrhizobium zhanjiangense TaxID=1325107 RepID=A0A4Q0SMT0_9BRAD|nr:hypothetical protein [Bradyrhizobium zhanjiangense]RXH41063.1 hypothetical protein XH94_09475 [Bradyrhizobium zhanjiangense]